ncbi:RNA-dependent DNA polymerase [Rhizobium sp. S-51]|uniref:RNA-dependent DNA polymerase n=1 Tax=Rhizobium terricola TaxID=2728849 RepID=A0A7Y0FUH4_9HYPH|nr:reverse transcriptase domain-containing protein [Rhizobium terricola]NML72766.1 RNA-dependent DNA polymerase [Rhizobium terricola]
MTSELLKAVRRLDNLESAWSVVQSNGRASQSENVRLELEKFAEDAPTRLRSIKGKLGSNSFEFAAARGIPIPKTDSHGKRTGKFRPIVLSSVESRIVQRAILNVLLEVPSLKPYVKTPYSFGGIKGERGPQSDRKARSLSVAAVPAAIKAILDEIAEGARFVASADIRSFFTRISKDAVTEIISSAVKDDEFVKLFRAAINVELENLAQLREKAKDFPIQDIGVAQGNSLSPLLGNIILAHFDSVMNEGDCRCIRYIDDFIILAPTKKAAEARLRKAIQLLASLDMELSPEKSSKGGISIEHGFDFLGINISPGAIRPGGQAQAKIVASVQAAFGDSIKAMRKAQNGQKLDRSSSLVATLKRVDGMIDGWAKHYWFCNDKQTFEIIDKKITELVRRYLGEYTNVRKSTDECSHLTLLGISEINLIPREPFSYPKLGKASKAR